MKLRVNLVVEPLRVTVGAPSTVELAVTNDGKSRMLPLKMELAVGRNAVVFDVPSLPSGGSHDELFVLPTSRRSVIPVGPATSVRGDPLGLTRRALDWTTPVSLYVHPRITRLEHLGAGFLRDLEGQVTNDLSTNDLAFHALREYAPGDDRRFIHWKTTARVGDLMVRQFVDTRRSHLAVVVDTDESSYLDEEEFELAVSLAGSLGVRAKLDEQEVTLSAGDAIHECNDGQQLLDQLAGVESRGGGIDVLGQSLRLQRTAASVSTAAIFTGSARPVTDLSAASSRFGESVRKLVVRAQPDGAAALRPLGSMTVLTVCRLEEFGFLLFKASQ
jgi:uncharacterized protein (DUF58 family)